MLDNRVASIAQKSAQAKIRDLEEPFRLGLRGIVQRWHGNGAMYYYVLRHFQAEVSQRAQIIWAALHRVHSSLGAELSNSLREDLNSAFRNELELQWEALRPEFEKNMARAPVSAKESPWIDQLRDAVGHERARYGAEIDLYVSVIEAALKKGVPQPVAYTLNLNNVQIGALQTGVGAVANVTQNFGRAEREALIKAVQEVREVIAHDLGTDEKKREELVQMADETVGEIKKESPNEIKLMASLQILAAAVQGIASAPMALEALRTAGRAIGWNF